MFWIEDYHEDEEDDYEFANGAVDGEEEEKIHYNKTRNVKIVKNRSQP